MTPTSNGPALPSMLDPRRRGFDTERAPGFSARGRPSFLGLDPAARTLEACRLEAGRWVLLGTWRDGPTVCVEPFDAVGLDLGELWGA